MRHESMTGRFIDREKTLERTGRYVGRLGDLGLGSPKGIPSRYAELNASQLHEIAEKKARKLLLPTDVRATSCIDGRKRQENADGSIPEIRYRRVGGSASNLGVAFNAQAPIVDTLRVEDGLGTQIETIDLQVARLTGFERSAHLGGCGGANGEVDDNEAIHSDSTILEATKAFLELPDVAEYFSEGHEDELAGGAIYDEVLAEWVRERAGQSAQYLRAKGWDGQKYVDGVVKDNPRGVEDLEVDHSDEEFHGHKEPSLVAVIGEETLVGDDFVWNLEASKRVAEALAGGRGIEGYKQAVIAEVAKHMAVAKRLPSDKTPLFLLMSKRS